MADFTTIWIDSLGLYVFGGKSQGYTDIRLITLEFLNLRDLSDEPNWSKDRSITDVHFMDNNYNWSKVAQSMKSGRMGHASIYDGTDG